MLKILDIKYRKEPIKHTKLQHFEEKNNLVKRKSDKLYDYYICDYCGSEIRLDIKQTERSGGIARQIKIFSMYVIFNYLLQVKYQ